MSPITKATPDKDAAADLVWSCPDFQYRPLGQSTQSDGGPQTVRRVEERFMAVVHHRSQESAEYPLEAPTAASESERAAVRKATARLERLESRVAVAGDQTMLRFGHLRRLPPDYKGEKHVVIAKQLPNRNGEEWVEFEEVPGPDPNPQERKAGRPDCIDIVLVKPYSVGARYTAVVKTRLRHSEGGSDHAGLSGRPASEWSMLTGQNTGRGRMSRATSARLG